jgi:iron(III) transport system substrate-binding protein
MKKTVSSTSTAVASTLIGLLAAAVFSGQALAQDAALIEAAKKEGKLTYYTTRMVDAMNMFTRAFEAKYGIKVEASRHTNEDLIRKIINESGAGRSSADVFDGSSGITLLMDAGLVAPFKPKEAEAYAPEFKDPKGNWTAVNIYVAGLVYNSDVVKEADVPKKADDLLDPKWHGRKITYTMQFTVSGLNGFFGGLEKERGTEKAKEFITALHKNGGVAQNATPGAVLDTVASGQYAICIGCNTNGVAILTRKGAPVAMTTKVQPIVSFMSALGVTKNAASPNAARLFIEFLLSKEGQMMMEEKTDVMSARTDFESKFAALKPGPNTFTAFAVTPEIVAKDLTRWSQIQTEIRK